MDREAIFTTREILLIILSSVVFALILGFNEWGYNEFNAYIGITNTTTYFFSVFFALIIMRLIQKLVARHYGYDATFTINKYHILFSFLLTFISYGALPIFFPGKLEIQPNKFKRVGRFRELMMASELKLSLLVGILPFIFFSLLGFNVIAWISGLLVLYSFLPLPELDGATLLHAMGLKAYALTMFFIIVYLITYSYSRLIGLIIAIIALIAASNYLKDKLP